MCRFGRIKDHITQDVWPFNYCAIAYVWSLPKSLKSLGLYEVDRQSKTYRQGRHCWELQDEPFASCGRIDATCMDLRNRVFSLHLIVFLLRATKKEEKLALKRLRYYVSSDAQGNVYCK